MKIAISSGHYANTGGKRTPPMPYSLDVDGDGIYDIQAGEQYREHYANTGVCYYLDIALRRCGFDTFKVGWNDKNGKDDYDDISLSYRQVITAAEGCDIYVSIHFNAFGAGDSFNDADGVCTFIHSDPKKAKDSKSLALKIQKYLSQGTKQRNRGVLESDFSECNAQIMNVRAACLCELAFMTNLHESTTMMAKESFWIESAEEICKGVCEYTGVKYIEPIINEDEEEMSYDTFKEYMAQYLKELAFMSPAAWSEEARNWAESSGIIKGDENGNKQYKKFLTREEYVQMEYRQNGNK